MVSVGRSITDRIRNGSVVLVHCNVTGVNIPTIEWFKDDTVITTNSKLIISSSLYVAEVLIISSFQPQDSGTYKCVASNVAGVASENITLESQLLILSNSVVNMCCFVFRLLFSVSASSSFNV